MGQQRRKFSPQFTAEAVQFVFESGRPVAHVARELQINEGTHRRPPQPACRDPNLVLDDGTTFNDLIDEASSSARNHGKFVSNVANLSNDSAEPGLITGREAGAIRSSTGRAR